MISIPLLIRTYGLDGYGRYVFIVSIISYSERIIIFGYDYYLLRYAVENRGNYPAINKYYNASVYSRIIIFILLYFVILGIGLTKYSSWDILLFSILYLTLLKFIFIPQWYFQSINNLNILSYISLYGNILILIGSIAVYMFKLPIYYYAISVLLSSIIQILIVHNKLKNRLYAYQDHYQDIINDIIHLTKVSYINMLSGLSQLYTNFTIILLGILFSSEVVAIYEISSRIVNFIKTPFVMFNNSVYPEILRKKDLKLTGKYYLIEIIIIVISIGLLSKMKPYIFLYFVGSETPSHDYILGLLSITILAVISNQVLGFHILYNYGFDKIRARGVIYSSLLYIISVGVYILFGFDSVVYICVALVAAEFNTSIYYIVNIYDLATKKRTHEEVML